MKLANPVVFELARKLGTGAGSLANRAAGAVSRQYSREIAPYNQPGENIQLQPFRAGEVSTGAGIARLGTAIMSAARNHANWQYARDQQVAAQEKSRLETEQLRQKVSGTTPITPYEQGQLDKKPSATPRTPVHLTHDVFGFKAGQDVDPSELAAGGVAAHVAAAGQRRADSKAYQAAQATLRNIRERTSPYGPYAFSIHHNIAAASDSLSAAIAGKDKLAKGHALARLGLPSNYKLESDNGTALRAALAYFRGNAATDSLAAESQRWEPTRRAAEAVTRKSGGVDPGAAEDLTPESDPENLFP
jgi:hypothetical protein